MLPFCILQYFYEEQLHRMECLSQEPVLFEDVLCQMHDMIQPRCRLPGSVQQKTIVYLSVVLLESQLTWRKAGRLYGY